MNLRQKYCEFKEWQQRPYQVAPLSQQEHTCTTCGTIFQGNYCPRCGQSGRIGRYSLKAAFLLFLDVWGLGNRGMFRSIRDLLLRPGYMIRDYLGGMQMAYFPPFKMFFLLATFSILVSSGFNLKGENQLSKAIESYEKGFDVVQQESNQISDEEDEDYKKKHAKTIEIGKKINSVVKSFIKFLTDHQTLVELFWLLILSLPLYTLFKDSPAIPDLYYPEFFVAMVYITNLMNIVSTVASFLCINLVAIGLISPLLSIIALKQLSGYSYFRTTLSLIASIVIIGIACMIIVVMIGIVAGFMLANYAS